MHNCAAGLVAGLEKPDSAVGKIRKNTVYTDREAEDFQQVLEARGVRGDLALIGPEGVGMNLEAGIMGGV